MVNKLTMPLRALFTASVGPEPRVAAGVPAAPMPALPPLGTLVDDSATARHGLVMVMGKGGVGTTTIAAAIATELAARGFLVHLTTTDPAAHVAATLAITVPGLTVSRIDPAVETQAYRHRALENAAPTLDA